MSRMSDANPMMVKTQKTADRKITTEDRGVVRQELVAGIDVNAFLWFSEILRFAFLLA
jgi:hypothetical protein